MNSVKGYLQSRTIIAAFVGLLAAILSHAGIELPATPEEMTDTIFTAVEFGSFIAAAWFRYKASAVVVPKARVAAGELP